MKKILLTIAAFAIIGLSGTAHAGVVVLKLGGQSSSIHFVEDGVARTIGGGSFDPSVLDGRSLDYLYCVDMGHYITLNRDYTYTDVNNTALIHGAEVHNAGKVAYLLKNYGVGGHGDEAIALQAAIWHEIYGANYYLNSASYGATSNIPHLYNDYVTAADNSTTGDVSKFIWIKPGNSVNDTGYQGLVTSSPTPEPSTYALMGIGGLFAAFWFKKSTGTLAPTV
jgi:hypothetical protein